MFSLADGIWAPSDMFSTSETFDLHYSVHTDTYEDGPQIGHDTKMRRREWEDQKSSMTGTEIEL